MIPCYIWFYFQCSRQRYVLGDSAMKQMAHSNVFLSGLGGLGVEIGKVHCTWIGFLKSLHTNREGQ